VIKAVIFDFGYTLYDPILKGFQPDAASTLEFMLNKKLRLILVSRTSDTLVRERQINEAGFNLYFDYVDIVKKGDNKDFTKILSRYNFNPEEFLVVGDRLTSEITQGKKLGMKTCRFLYGPEKALIAQNRFEQPDYTVERISEVTHLI
jgi:putative hydrolase of the HAD superfamily